MGRRCSRRTCHPPSLLHLALLAAAAAAALQQKFILDEVKREGGEAFAEAKAVVVAHNELLFG